MPPVTMNLPAENHGKTEEELAVAKPVIGIIYPPPEVRNIVDKTASFVARNGPEFESRIRKNEMNNAKFNFLNPSDPYHAYYQHKVREFKEGRGQEPVAPKPAQGAPFSQKPAEQAKIMQEIIVPKEPPPEFEFIADPPSISAFDLDVVKLTAQFVARNGRQFLTNLMNREQRNYQFDFLRPQHSLFNYFTKLVEQYTKILIPPKDLLDKLQKESFDYKDVLNQVKYRVEWQRHQDREKRKEEEAIERERVAYAQIDWHDFVVVETVDFQPNESGNLPPPTTPGEVGARMLVQERIHRGELDADEMEVESDEEDESDEEERVTVKAMEQANTQIQDMEEASDEEEEMPIHRKAPHPPPHPPPPPGPPPPTDNLPPLPPTPDQVIIRKNYDPKARAVQPETGAEQFMVSPITGEKIPASKVQEHMRIGLLDPAWIKERQKVVKEKQEQEEVYAPGTSIEMSLKGLAERRTDIFGVGIEETQIGKKIGEEETKEPKKVVWDGHTASMEKVTQKARENISIEEQIKTIHKVKGFMQDAEKEKIGPNIPKNPPPPPKVAPPPPPISKQAKPPPPPPQSATAQLNPAPLMSQAVPQRPGLMVLPPRPPMPIVRMQPPMPVASHQFMPGPPQPPGFPRHMMPAGAAPPPGIPPPPQDDEPPTKKQKTEDQLIPEEIFLSRNKAPVTFKVSVPKVDDKPEWNLKGQTVSFTLPLTDTISVMKAKLNESLGIPAGKQKLQYEGIFVKDSNSLAYYNVVQGGTISLQLKERGGRKK